MRSVVRETVGCGVVGVASIDQDGILQIRRVRDDAA